MLGTLEATEEVAESGTADDSEGPNIIVVYDVEEDRDQEENQGDNQAEETLVVDVEEARVDEEQVEV